jgi:tetratricopeptide (TPR) repeat protein
MNWRARKSVPDRDNFSRFFLARLAAAVIFALVLSCATIHPRQTSSAEAEHLKREAHASIANRQWDAAIQSYEKAIALAPNELSLRVELGAVLMKSGQPTDSIAAFQEALRMAPRNLTAELGLAQGYRGVRNNEEAKRVLERAIREHPKSPEPLAAIGEFEIQQQTYDAAIGHLKASLVLAPANAETRNLLAAAYKAKGDLANALAELDKVLARDPNNALAHFLRAEIYSDQNQDALALPDAQKVVALQPENLRGRTVLGKILLRTPEGSTQEEISKRCSEAVAALEPVAESEAKANSTGSETLFLLSRAYRCAGQAEQAGKTAAEFESASQKERSAKENEAQANHLVQQANDAALKNDFQGAVSLLQQALAKDPNSGAAYSILAKLYYSAGDLEKASDAIREALVRGPHQPDFLYVQGKILEKRGNFDEALASFEQTTLINPRESDAYFEIGAIYQQRNDRTRAIAAYKKAVEISPDDPDYRKALASLTGGKTASP